MPMHCYLPNVNDNQAKLLSGDLYAKLPMLQAAETVFSKKLTEISDEDWETLLKRRTLCDYRLSF